MATITATSGPNLAPWLRRLSQPHAAFGGLPACPYAGRAKYEVIVARRNHVHWALAQAGERLKHHLVGDRPDVMIVDLDPRFDRGQLAELVKAQNRAWAARDLVVLVSDAAEPVVVAGFRTTPHQGLLLMVQRRAELVAARQKLKQQGYYTNWSDEDLHRI